MLTPEWDLHWLQKWHRQQIEKYEFLNPGISTSGVHLSLSKGDQIYRLLVIQIGFKIIRNVKTGWAHIDLRKHWS